MTSTNKIVNSYLNNSRINKERFDDLKIVVETVGNNTKILDWFAYLQSIETVGWRPKLVTKKIAQLLSVSSKSKPVEFYALFCPSYKKGEAAYGFRRDAVGNTTIWGIDTLKKIVDQTQKLGIPVKKPRAIFFDIAIEQPEKTIKEISDLKINIKNLKKHIPSNMEFQLLSDVFPFLYETIGYSGIKINPLPIPRKVLNRIIERGAKFYELFGWSDKLIKERSEIIASSEALVGNTVRYLMPNSIMVYTPTMLERAQVYSGHKFETDPLPIIFPKHE